MAVGPYELQTGDDLSVIAGAAGMTLEEVERANPNMPIKNWWREAIKWNEAGAVVWITGAGGGDFQDSGWVSWTPVWTGTTLGNAIQSFQYRYESVNLHIVGYIGYGSTTSWSTYFAQMELPDGFVPPSLPSAPIFGGYVYDVSANKNWIVMGSLNGPDLTFVYNDPDLSRNLLINQTQPMAWVSGDLLQINLVVPGPSTA